MKKCDPCHVSASGPSLYCDSNECRQTATNWHGRNTMDIKHSTDTPLSQTNVSMSLSLIQKQCEKLLQQGQTELSLEDPEKLAASGRYSCNPYDHSE